MSAAGNVVQMPDMAGVGSMVHATPLIPPGVYSLAFIKYETVWQFRSHKLRLDFRVVTPGPAFGAVLTRYYAVRSVSTKSRRKGGQFQFGQKCDFFREYCRVFGAPSRPDRISPASYRNTVVSAQIVTVMRGHDQQPIPEGAQYSKVARLLSLEAGSK